MMGNKRNDPFSNRKIERFPEQRNQRPFLENSSRSLLAQSTITPLNRLTIFLDDIMQSLSGRIHRICIENVFIRQSNGNRRAVIDFPLIPLMEGIGRIIAPTTQTNPLTA
jgi:hypothetical protein